MQCKLPLYENICFLSYIRSRADSSPTSFPATDLIAHFFEAAAYGEAGSSCTSCSYLKEQKETPVLAVMDSTVSGCAVYGLQMRGRKGSVVQRGFPRNPKASGFRVEKLPGSLVPSLISRGQFSSHVQARLRDATSHPSAILSSYVSIPLSQEHFVGT